ncbi:hypothetical protein NC796_15875 [Aliifodinibius sp. S!AR15-10]|uniref:DUF6010 family protein n=1 Tax=Aliifodinibius sp. S!AR15-10 TaxID=2950437 RepID=UPI002863133C|nr:DUF6010 family protein [Aliifodinibius sp. S!AR15-10]MDR8392635.1 hypothetical protein [Aliifodinibius sp. S!AR15-10]
MNYLYWLILGIILGTILLYNVSSKGKKDSEKRMLSIGLIVAAGLYPGFAIIWGNGTWVLVELAGIPIFGSFVWLANRCSYNWLAIGWGSHTAWDGLIHLFGPGRVIAPEWYVVTCISFDLILAGYILFSDK